MSARDLAPGLAIAGLGNPASLRRLTEEITALNTELAEERSGYTSQELFDLRNNLNTLALAIVRIKRLVSERIAVLTAGGFNGY